MASTANKQKQKVEKEWETNMYELTSQNGWKITRKRKSDKTILRLKYLNAILHKYGKQKT